MSGLDTVCWHVPKSGSRRGCWGVSARYGSVGDGKDKIWWIRQIRWVEWIRRADLCLKVARDGSGPGTFPR